ncbi:S-layer homology domain-containing protein, partial [Candidatus Peregrinibacteria bacterium]|nr:S-layer homology domain-containing protein [Candidatus Peregrinibacteria bacterium]
MERWYMWKRAFEEIKKAISDWKLLIKVAITYHASCDKCQTDRFSLLELVLRIFAALPQIPIIPLPKWPDIVLDASSLQVGVELVWPEINIRTQPFIFPTLPRLRLPRIPSLSFKLPDFPVLPEAPNFAALLPEFPPLPLVKIPDMPPPPAIPQLPGQIKVALRILEKIMLILCLLKTGKIIVPESLLKTEIEAQTQRALDPLLPLDLSLPILLPAIQYDFVKAIKLNVSVNMSVDTRFFYKKVKDFFDEINLKIQKYVDRANIFMNIGAQILDYGLNAGQQYLEEQMEEAAQDAQEELDKAEEDLQEDIDEALNPGEEEKNDRDKEDEYDGEELKTKTEPVTFEDKGFEDLPMLKPYIAELKKSFSAFEEITKGYEEQIAATPKIHHLVATQEFLYKNDPRLNRTIEDLKYNRAKYEMDSLPVSTQRIANLRDNLISTLERRASLADELKNTKSIPDALRIFAQGAKFGKYELASAQSKNGILFESSNESELASLLSGSNISQAKKEGFKALTTALKGSLAETSSFLEEVVTNSAQFTSKLIAQNGNPPPGNPDSSGLSLNLSGILVENKEKGTLEKLFEYDQETQLPGKNLFVDVDGDKDQDVLYFYGPNLYFKENYRYTSSSSIVTSSPKVYELIEMMPKAPSINGAKIIDIKNGKVTIGFQKQPFSAVKGYEVHYYSKVPEFDLPLKQQQAKSGVVFLSPKKGEIPISDTSVSDALNYAVTKGEVKVTKSNSGNDEAKTLYPGDSITTLEGSEAVLTWSDGSQLLIGANSAFRVPALANSNEISFSEGEFTILKRSGENVLLKSGKIISGANARVTIELHSEENIILESNSLFSLSELQKAGAFINEVEGKTLITGGSRRFLEEGASASISGAESIHGLSESTVILSKGEGDNASAQITLKLKTQTIFAPSFDGTLTVEDGLIEIINPEKQIKDQEVRDEMVIFTNELLIAEDANSMARVGFSDSPELETTILGQESFKMVEFDDDAARADVTVELDLPNGDYYTKIYSVGFDGGRSTGSSMSLLPPQRCADQIPPVANAGSSSKQVALFKSLTLDVSASFDDIQVKDYWWDLDTRVDSNSDGDKSNDVDYFSTFDKPRKIIGPFKDLEKIPVKLFVRDDRNNISTQEVTVEVYVPEITLNEAAAKTGIIEGVLNPAESAMPITLLRKRGEAWEILKTESSEANGTYLSDSEGKFTINDLNLLQGVEIKNAAGKTVATVDAVTGHITVVDPAYQLKVFPSEPPLPTRVALIGPEGELVSTFYVPDANSDIVLDEEEIEYSKENVSKLSGVHVKDTNPEDEIAFKKIPADDPKNPGGVKAEQKNQGMGAGFLFTQALAQANGEILFEVTSNGSIYVYSEIVDLKLKESENPDDPVIIEFYVDGKKVGEQLISVKTAVRESIPIITIPKEKGAKDSDLDGLPDSYELAKKFNPKDPNDAKKDFDGDGLSNFAEYLQGTDPHKFDTDADTYSDKEEIEKGYNPNEKLISPFEDVAINYPKFKVLLDLVSKNVLQGYKENGKVYFKPDQKINRAEFTKIMLKVLCIAPRAEAYRSPPVFSDIPYITEKLPWFYDEVKESFLQGFITGYLGEIDQKTKKAPFKAENTITLAEATKIVLEALEKEGVIFMGKVILGEGQPWFAPYLQFATNLGYYLRKPSPGANEFILTEEEAKNPAKTLSRIEFVEMASRVLSAYDCSNVDNDKDKLPDNFEINNNLNTNLAADANQDPDKDGLKNIEEFVYGTDPHNADTDSGGEKDGAEVKNYTNPLNKDDDKNSDPDNDGLSNATERQLGTDPKNSDTDYGGDKDGEEVSRGADPLYEGDDDPDKDGLKNFEERRYGSNPFDPDTDKGGIRDGKEAKLGFNPTKKQDDDSDADGLSDLDEDNRYLTNKFLFDTDHGGIGDGEEISKKTNPLDANDDDPDKDGLVNLEESVYGTNPFIFDTDKGCSG